MALVETDESIFIDVGFYFFKRLVQTQRHLVFVGLNLIS